MCSKTQRPTLGSYQLLANVVNILFHSDLFAHIYFEAECKVDSIGRQFANMGPWDEGQDAPTESDMKH
jgi:hypothetical protein